MSTTDNLNDTREIAKEHAQEAAEAVQARTGEVAGHAKEATQGVATTAVEQAGNVKQETVRQARNLMSEAGSQVSTQAGEQTQRMTGLLRELADELHQMASSGNGGYASELAYQASERAHQAAGYLEGRQPGDLLDDVRHYARRRPGTFLVGAALLGLAAGRLGRGVKDAGGSSPAVSAAASDWLRLRAARTSGHRPLGRPEHGAVLQQRPGSGRRGPHCAHRPPGVRIEQHRLPTMTASTGNTTGTDQTIDVRDRSVGDLLGQISKDMSQLMHQEIDLAKAEVRQEAGKLGKGAGMLGGAGFAGYMVALFASLTLAYGIGTFWPAWIGALIVALLWAAVGAVLYPRGRRQLKTVTGPVQTKETLKEDAAWVRHPTS